ncbi:DUS3L (predicted) [Pycnogonum litorale]
MDVEAIDTSSDDKDKEISQPKHISDGKLEIKPEYLLPEHERTVNSEYLSKVDKERIDSDKQSSLDGPPKKKFKGQNKKRPREMRIPKSEKLCMKIFSEAECPYGDKCCFSHDIDKFMKDKLPDISTECYLYRTYGRCQYGLICRFGSSHISETFENKIDEELWEKHKDKCYFTNILPRNLQISLRSRSYCFKKTNNILKSIGLTKNSEASKSEACDTIADDRSADQSIQSCKSNSPSGSSFEVLNGTSSKLHTSGVVTDEDIIRTRVAEKKKINFEDKLYLAPLTTVGNLPFRRICKEFGADVTCGEMALCANILQGQQSEWALLRRHESEDLFGVQVCGAHPDMMTRCSQVIEENINVDFVDINMGCPIDLVYQKGAGSGLMGRQKKLEDIINGMSSMLSVPLTVKLRTGIYENRHIADNLIKKINDWGSDRVSLITLHGRSREQRYTKMADWNFIARCAELAKPIPMFGNGDVLSYEDYYRNKQLYNVSGIMVARGALMKPWIFTEIKERRHWDITSSERFDMLKSYINYGLENWGSDTEGVEKTRRFLLEWLSFLYRYVPVGLLENVPQKINERPPKYCGRDDLETLMASPNCADWIKISEMLLGPVPSNFSFLPKHKANSYS